MRRLSAFIGLFIILSVVLLNQVQGAPAVVIYFPNGTINYGGYNQSLILNFTATDANLASCWYNYNSVNTSVGCPNSTAINKSIGYSLAGDAGTLNNKQGVQITTFNSDIYVYGLIKKTGVGNAVAYILDSSGNVIASNSSALIGNYYPFNNIKLYANNVYYFVTDGAGYQSYYSVFSTSTNDFPYFNVTYGLESNLPSGDLYNFLSANVSLAGTSTFKQLEINKNNLTVYANDSLGNTGSVFTSWNYNLFENSQVYNTPVFETSNESFIIHITYDNSAYTLGNAYLIYNGTSQLTPFYSGSGSNLIYNANMFILTVPISGTVKNFYWSFNLINSTGAFSFNSSVNTQTINKGIPLNISTSCQIGFSPALNFTFFLENNRTNINASSVKYYLTYGLAGNSSANSINSSINNIAGFAICINNSQSYYNVGYGEIQYSVIGSTDRRYYIFSNTRLTNSTVNVPLFSLDTSLSTSFLITAETTALMPYVNYYVGLLRWYPEINSYQVVELGKTDEQGQTVLRLKTEDVDYRLVLYQSDGTLVKLLNPIRFVCQTNPCVYSIFIDPSPLDLTTFTNIESSLTWNASLSRFTFIWNDPSQHSQVMNLTVWKDTGTGSSVLCSNSASGYVGVLTCDIVGATGQIRAEAVRTASPSTLIAQVLISIRDTLIKEGGGALGLFFSALILIFLALAGSFNPILGIVLAVVGLIPMVMFGLIDKVTFAVIGVTGGVIWYFISKN